MAAGLSDHDGTPDTEAELPYQECPPHTEVAMRPHLVVIILVADLIFLVLVCGLLMLI